MQYPSHFIQSNKLRLHFKDVGPKDAPVLIFLHGFPEFWYGWRGQIEYFVNQGYRVLVPDQRGYNLSDKPKAVEAYRMKYLAEDIVNLVQYTGREKVYLVGHDWGAGVAWHLALLQPDLFHKIVVINVPHPFVFKKVLFGSLRQLFKSWYFFLFQLPFLPEFLGRLGNFAGLSRGMQRTALPETFSVEDIETYKIAWNQKQSYRSMVNWYRAAFRYPKDAKQYRDKQVSIPLKIIWGKEDTFLLATMAEMSLDYCESGTLRMVEEATHWVVHERRDLVNEEIRAFFAGE